MGSFLKKSFVFLMVLFLTACSGKSVDDLKEEGELIVLTRNAPTTWYQDRDGDAGFEYELIESFAKANDLKVKYIIKDDFEDLLTLITTGKAHIAAAGITKTSMREQQGYLFGPEYQEVQQHVVCRRSKKAIPKKIADLIERQITVVAASTYIDSLKRFKKEQPEITWTVDSDSSTEQLLQRVWQREIDCTIADSNIIKISQRYYPELVSAFPATEKEPLAWVVAPKWSGLIPDIKDWLATIKDDGTFAIIEERYYGHIQLYDYVDNRTFTRRVKRRLPKYKKMFSTAATRYKLPWTLLAAQSYQESHWNPRAISPTGVRGMMMLTLPTAKAMGVTSRLDPVQSINGGAKYLTKMIKRIPKEVQDEDRIWFALTAYNIGYGHLKDAMELAKSKGLDENKWVNLKEILPLLSQKKYYKKLKYGYARGTEPVRYVQRIREYQLVLDKLVVTAK